MPVRRKPGRGGLQISAGLSVGPTYALTDPISIAWQKGLAGLRFRKIHLLRAIIKLPFMVAM
jgi:hypothetical protein